MGYIEKMDYPGAEGTPAWYDANRVESLRKLRHTLLDMHGGDSDTRQMAENDTEITRRLIQLRDENPDIAQYLAFHILAGSTPKSLTRLNGFDYEDGRIVQMMREAAEAIMSSNGEEKES